MAVSGISSIYSSLYTSLLSNTRSADGTKTKSGSGSTVQDILEFGSSENYLSAYLDYDYTGNYSSRAALPVYLDSEGGSSCSLADMLNGDNSEDSGSDIFNSLISAKTEEINNLISIAMKKLESKASDDVNAATDNEG